MNRVEFEALRQLPGKMIREDVVLRPDPRTGKTLRAKDIRVENGIGWGIAVDIHYDPRFPKFIVNFRPMVWDQYAGYVRMGPNTTIRADIISMN